jgi:hypothetical protein
MDETINNNIEALKKKKYLIETMEALITLRNSLNTSLIEIEKIRIEQEAIKGVLTQHTESIDQFEKKIDILGI